MIKIDTSLIVEVGDCHEWNGRYGTGLSHQTPVISHRINGNHSRYSVRRAMWENAGKPIPKGHVVFSTCGNYRCVLVDHLRCGTRAQQIAFAAKTGRMKCSQERRSKSAMAARARSPYTPEQIAKVRELLAEGGLSDREIGRQTGVSYYTVADVRNGVSWRNDLNGASVFSWIGQISLKPCNAKR